MAGVEMGEIPEATIPEVDLYTVLSTAASHFEKSENLAGFAEFFQRQAKKELAKSSPDGSVVVSLETEQAVNDRLVRSLVGPTVAATSTPPIETTDVTPREAFELGDVELSKKAHAAKKTGDKDENHVSQHGGDKLKSIVYGGLDGIITTFAVVSGAAGGGLGTDVVLILGVSNMFADALSMGMGDALSTKAENDMILKERKREQWEYENNPDDEKQEMIDIYVEKGLSRDVATEIIGLMVSNEKFFVDQMVQDELGLTVPDEDDNPWHDGFITFCSFVGFGTVPLLAYLTTGGADFSSDTLFVISIILTAVMLFVLGVCKSLCTSQTWYESGFEILIFGGITAAVSYGLGAMVEGIVHS